MRCDANVRRLINQEALRPPVPATMWARERESSSRSGSATVFVDQSVEALATQNGS